MTGKIASIRMIPLSNLTPVPLSNSPVVGFDPLQGFEGNHKGRGSRERGSLMDSEIRLDGWQRISTDKGNLAGNIQLACQ